MSSTHTVTIEKIIDGGDGLARLSSGLVVMVPLTLPGEEVQVKLVDTKKRYSHASLVEIISPSKQRIVPVCPNFGLCGGCDFMHISYEAQLKEKQSLLLEHLCGFDLDPVVLPIIPAEKTTLYRQRVRFQVDPRARIGFHQSLSNVVVPTQHCFLARPAINSVLKWINEHKESLTIFNNCEALEFMENLSTGLVSCFIHLTRKPRASDSSSASYIVDHAPGMYSVLVTSPKNGNVGPFFTSKNQDQMRQEDNELCFALDLEERESVSLCYEVGGFCQVHPEQNQKLVKTVLDWVTPSDNLTVLDLFCGLGNFSIPLARFAKSVVGLDLQRSAIRSAKKNAVENKLSNCTFKQKSALHGTRELLQQGEVFDLVLLDPPRAGCKEVIPYLSSLSASHIIMISCNPATLSRDLTLLKKEGFELERLQAIDMFPQTHHLETMVQLVRKDKP